MAISFTPLKLNSQAYFGISLQGSFGRADKKRLRDLAAKCLANHKTNLVFDLAGLESLGGGGAAELAELQRQLLDLNGELIVVGASPTVLQFLTHSFDDLHLRCYRSVDAAEQELLIGAQNEVSDPSQGQPAQNSADGEPPVCEDLTPDSSLDEILGTSATDARHDTATVRNKKNAVEDPVLLSETPLPDPPDRLNQSAQENSPGDVTAGNSSKQNEPETTSRHYVSLSDAVISLQEATGPEDLGAHLLNLLYSHDLAKEVVYCRRQGNWFLGEDDKRAFTSSGKLALTLAAVQRPLSLLDVPTDELDKGEARFLSKASPDLILPVVWRGQLQAVAFLDRGKKDHEYSVSENFALELLMRVMAAYGDRRESSPTSPLPGSDPSSSPTGEGGEQSQAELEALTATVNEEYLDRFPSEEMYDQPAGGGMPNAALMWTRSLLRLVEAMTGALDEEMFWERVQQRLVGDHGISKLVVLVPGNDCIRPHVNFGVLESKASRLEISGSTGRRYLEGIIRPVTVENLPSSFKKYQTAMQKADLKWLVPLQANLDWIGIALLGETETEGKPPLGEDHAAEMFTKVATHLQRLQERNIVDERNLELITRLMSLMEERHYGPGGMSNELIHLVPLVAREMDFSPEQERDIIYGTIIRDIGMFPTGDLVIDSFGNVSEEQWQEYRAHPTLGGQRLEGLSVSAIVREVVLYHHERFNGEGYPQGLSEHDIPLAARIVAVVENYVAMITTMPNRPALSRTQALEIIQENFGNRYDPEVVTAFLSVLEKEKQDSRTETALIHS